MSLQYPPTGCYDDLLMLLARCEEKRMAGKLPIKGRLARIWKEPLWNLVGVFLAAMVRMLPADMAARIHDKLFLALIGSKTVYPFDKDSEHLKRAQAMKADAERIAGRPAALFCLTSHPPAFGELLYLNVELMRHALWALGRLRGAACRPRLVIGLDYFALDMLALYEEGAYAGFTGRYHVGFDRLSHLRPAVGKGLLAGTSWEHVANRLISRFSAGGEVGMVLGGGVPGTSRVFYCAREFVGQLYRERPGRTSVKEARARLHTDAPAFERFCSSGELGFAVRRNLRRCMEAWVLSCLSGEAGLTEVDAGRPTLAGREAVAACAHALGWSPLETKEKIREFEEEFARETPYRERFFSAVAQRVAGRGTPVVILPLTYGSPEHVEMRFADPVCLMGFSRENNVPAVRLLGEDAPVALRRFCREFVAGRYP